MITPITVSAPAISPRISTPFQCSWLTPRASALLTEWSAMHGYSDRVRQRTRQSTKPRNPSGTRYCEDAEPVCASPNRIPVRIAATQVPRSRPATVIRIRRRPPKMKPRKKNSSQIGAITHTKMVAATSAPVLLLTPSSLGSLSLPCRPISDAYTAVTT